MSNSSLITSQPAKCPSPLVKADKLAWLIWERPDLQKAQTFLEDFGLHPVTQTGQHLYMRGTEAQPFCYVVRQATVARFAGFALSVASRDDLQCLATHFGLPEPQALDVPGGGWGIELRDPAGFLVQVVAGQSKVEPLPVRDPLTSNNAFEQPRINQTQRSEPRADVIRLGHVVLEVANYQEVSAWYTSTFGFIPSDVQVLPDGSPAVTFYRLDLGQTPADHHTLAIAQGFMATYSHSAFEVVDSDAVGMGQRLLREKGYRHAWGIGRHILGSQIFDYWNDSWGAKHEHYSDGDLFTSDIPMGVHAVNREAMSQWGQPLPRSFTKPHLTMTAVSALFRNVRKVPDLSLSKLLTLARLFG